MLPLPQIVNNPLLLPDDMNPLLKDLLEGLLCKGSSRAQFHRLIIFSPILLLTYNSDYADPKQRLTLEAVARHPWVIQDDGSIPDFLCWCKHGRMQAVSSDGSGAADTNS